MPWSWNRRRNAFTLVELLVVIAIIGALVSLLLPAIGAAREQARKIHCANNIRQLALGTLNYESQKKAFPPAIVDDDGNFQDALHNGFVFLLPFIEELGLYDQYDFKEDWKSRGNLRLARTRVPMLICPSNSSAVADAGGIDGEPTDYAFCKGDQAFLCRRPAQRGLYDINSHTRIAQVTDGLSHTIAMGEAISNPKYLAIPP